MVALAAVLPRLPELRLLNVGSCSINYTGALALANELKHLPQLERLIINSIWGSSRVRDSVYDHIFRQLRHLPNLECLVMNGNPLCDDGAMVLAQTMRFLPRLRILALTKAQIGDVGIRAIASALPYTPHIQRLHVGGNRFGDAAFRLLRFAAAEHKGMVISWDFLQQKQSMAAATLIHIHKCAKRWGGTPTCLRRGG